MMQHTKAIPTIPIRITLLLAIATRKPAMLMHMMNDSARSLIVFPIITGGDTVGALPYDSSAEQSYHANDGKDDS
jgi:hypothetical protein